MLKYIKHLLHAPSKSTVVLKAYRPSCADDSTLEITEYLITCDCCGYAWTKTLYGKETEGN